MTARSFTGVKFYASDQGPETGEVGIKRIEKYAAEAGRLKADGSPDFSAQVRHMVTAEARRIERNKKRSATKSSA